MKKMLVVEDDVLSQKLLLRLFKGDFEIDVCDSADEFYKNYSSNFYDIIIMDISIKGSKHGLQLAKEIKVMPNLSRIPILCLTAHAFAKDRKTAYESGTDLFISKPVSNKMLKEAVNFLIK